MKRTILFILLIGAGSAITLSFSCKKEDKCVAGTGGGLTIVARIAHHGIVVPNDSLKPDTVWILFNATEWHGAPTGASMQVIGEPGEDHIHIPNLKCGDYYFYAKGWDTSGPFEVKGGYPKSFSETEGEIDITIPVSE